MRDPLGLSTSGKRRIVSSVRSPVAASAGSALLHRVTGDEEHHWHLWEDSVREKVSQLNDRSKEASADLDVSWRLDDHTSLDAKLSEGWIAVMGRGRESWRRRRHTWRTFLKRIVQPHRCPSKERSW